MRLQLILLTLALLAAPAMAQPGPAPGYDSAIDYAQDYAEGEAAAASGDPAGYAQGKATPEALQNETSHAIYVACWAADDQGLEPQPCEAYYTPRGEEPPEQPPCECNATDAGNETEAFVAESSNATQSHANATQAFASQSVEDPQNVTSTAPGFLNQTVEFVRGTVGGAVDLVLFIGGGVLTCLGISIKLGLGAWQAAGGAVATLGDTVFGAAKLGLTTVGDVGKAAGLGFVSGMGSMGGALGTAFGAIGSGLAAAAGAVGSGIATAFSAVGDGLQSAASATGDAFQAVGGAIADGWNAVADAVSGLFDGGDKAGGVKDTADGLLPDADADGLLDSVTGILE